MLRTLTRRRPRLLALLGLLAAGTAMAAGSVQTAAESGVRSPHLDPRGSNYPSPLVAGAPGVASARVPGSIQQWPREYPILVLPEEQGFTDLQNALDFCLASPAPQSTVLLSAGTFTGNFTLPPTGRTWIVGRDGVAATSIEGAPGVVQPVLTYAPLATASDAEALIFSVQVRGTDTAVVEYTASKSEAELMFHDCLVESLGAFPALRLTGGGLDQNNEMKLELGRLLGRVSGGRDLRADRLVRRRALFAEQRSRRG